MALIVANNLCYASVCIQACSARLELDHPGVVVNVPVDAVVDAVGKEAWVWRRTAPDRRQKQ